ncbi:MAG: hypothetical protein CBB72_002445 [Muricauda sp. TMED12]|nr:MAG: hypothetical protein CBB72_002445 [Muricauda sp. TMED12]
MGHTLVLIFSDGSTLYLDGLLKEIIGILKKEARNHREINIIRQFPSLYPLGKNIIRPKIPLGIIDTFPNNFQLDYRLR